MTVTATTSSSSRPLSPPSPETSNLGSLLLRSVGQANTGTSRDKALTKNNVDRTCRGIKQQYSFVVACCVYFVSICLGSPELLIKLFANSPGQSGLNSGPEVSISRQNINKLLVVVICRCMSYLVSSGLQVNFGMKNLFENVSLQTDATAGRTYGWGSCIQPYADKDGTWINSNYPKYTISRI